MVSKMAIFSDSSENSVYDSDNDSEQVARVYAKVCKLVMQRGYVNIRRLTNMNPMANSFLLSDVSYSKSNCEADDSSYILENIGAKYHLGHPLIIEFLLLPSIYSLPKLSKTTPMKCLPAFLIEQWIIQLLPRRLVSDRSDALSTLTTEIVAYCTSSMLNKLLWDKQSTNARKIKDLQCACRMTNLRNANVFSSCWFSIRAGEFSLKEKSADKLINDYGALVNHHSSAISIPSRAQTTMRTKLIKRTYLCDIPSHSHQHDTAGLCTTNTFARVNLGRADVLDTTVTSILELPTAPPLLMEIPSFMQNGTMSLPSKRSSESQTRHVNTCALLSSQSMPFPQVVAPGTPLKVLDPEETYLLPRTEPQTIVPKSPVVIMSDWNMQHSNQKLISGDLFKAASSPLEVPPCKQQRVINVQNETAKNQHVDDFITEFNSLNMEQSGRSNGDKPAQLMQLTYPDVPHGCKSNIMDKPCSSNAFDLATVQQVRSNDLETSPMPRLSITKSIPVVDKVRLSSSSITTRAFHNRTGLPLQSSPVPVKRHNSTSFDYDDTLVPYRAARSFQVFSQNAKSKPTDQQEENATMCIPSMMQEAAAPGLKAKKRPSTLSLTTHSSGSLPNKWSARSLASNDAVSTFSSSVTLPRLQSENSTTDYHHHHHHHTFSSFFPHFAPSTPQPMTSQQLLINFEESMLNGRIPPAGLVDGFKLELGASGSFYPRHLKLPVLAYFFQLSDDNAPSPYLGYVDLSVLSNRRGYHVPKKGSIQLTLFNPSSSVLKVFVVQYDLQDMPANCQTFLRQRTVYMPVANNITAISAFKGISKNQPCILPVDSGAGLLFVSEESSSVDGTLKSSAHDNASSTALSSFQLTSPTEFPIFPSEGLELPAYLRYLVHLRFHTTKSGHLYLHTDIRLIFATDKFEFDPRLATYEMRTLVDAPLNPRYSPKK